MSAPAQPIPLDSPDLAENPGRLVHAHCEMLTVPEFLSPTREGGRR